MPDTLPEDLELALDRTEHRRGHFGRPMIFFHETASTNDIALAMADRGAAEGTTVVALAQTAGRGRLGREWFSPPGAGLYVSIVCRNASAGSMLTLAAGVALTDGIRNATGLPVAIKWPNDIVVSDMAAPGGRRKLAGILAEGVMGPGGVQHVVVGVGINLRPAAYPARIAGRATSLEAELGRAVDRAGLLAEILCAFNEHLSALAAGECRSVLDRWRERAPSAVGTRIEWTADGLPRTGTTAGIDEDGALLVNAGKGVERIVGGEIVWG
jgi:BirA family transcriptional regulator, biotin operon repressor / biotin---[acetyl-CoA-carboxylase] ligase